MEIRAGATYVRAGQTLEIYSIVRVRDGAALESWRSGEDHALVTYSIVGLAAGRKKASCILHWRRGAEEVAP